MSYNISDYIITIKNAAKAQRKESVLKYSKMNRELSKTLKELEYLEDFKEEKEGERKILRVFLKYDKRTPRLVDVQIISKPTLRKYVSGKGIKDLEKRGRKTLILSTSSGVMTGKEAAKKGIGGEVLFAIW